MKSHFIDAWGIRLHVEEIGSGAPVVLLHGFTGSTRAMARVAEQLSDQYRIVSVDLVGHGRSEVPDDIEAYSMAACVAQLAAVLDELELRAAHWIGYSMGGRIALSFGVAHPERMRSALLIGASAGVRDLEQRAARIQDDEALAERIERDGVEAFVNFWTSQAFLVDERRLGARGVAEAREMGAGAQPPIHHALERICTPVCLVVGEDDLRFSAIAAELSQELPNARVAFIPDAGHAAHTDNPTAFVKVARRFLADAEAWHKTPHCAVNAESINQTRTK
jgi:2-succinyl-6-hydroxy-2,4-cyclohexadiene-1-carboxylate synthase